MRLFTGTVRLYYTFHTREGPALGGPRSRNFTFYATHALYRTHRGPKRPSARQWVPADWPASGGQLDRRPTAIQTSSTALPGHQRTPRRHIWPAPRAASRRHAAAARAAAWQQSKACSKAASGSFLPPTECSLWSGCMVDESYGVITHSSTVCACAGGGRLASSPGRAQALGSTAPPLQTSSARAPCHHPPVRRRCCNLADLRYIACSNALADSCAV